MSSHSRIALGWSTIAVSVIALLAGGAVTTYLLMQRFSIAGDQTQQSARPAGMSMATTAPSGGARDGATTASDQPLPDVVVTLSQEATKRAGIELVSVTRGTARSSAVRIPGTVEPNA